METVLVDIITIGDEILLGQTVDTNSAWLGSLFTEHGFTIRRILSISDKAEEIEAAVSNALSDVSLVLITGGLGPTNDDITKLCLTKYFGGSLVEHPEAYANMTAFVTQRGGVINDNNRQQALFPTNADFIPNTCGTASGMWFNRDEKVVVSMPGVPHEMKAMVAQSVLPKAKALFDTPHIYFKILFVSGISEALLAEKLYDFETQLPSAISLAYLPSPGLIKLRLLATNADEITVRNIVESQFEKLEQAVGTSHILGSSSEKNIDGISLFLQLKHCTVSTAESCTGGAIATYLTAVSGSSTYFKGSVVAYSNEVKQTVLSVSPELIEEDGAVSKGVVESMAENVRSLLKTDFGIATSGVAGPTGGTPEKPVGTVWIAVSGPHRTISEKYVFGAERDQNIQRSVMAVLRMLVQEIDASVT